MTCSEGLISVNAGFLDAEDRNGNGIPDHQDVEWQYHKALVHVLWLGWEAK